VFFSRRAIVRTFVRSLMAAEDSGSVSRQLQFLELNQVWMNLLFARQLTGCLTAFNRLLRNSELAERRVLPPFLDYRTAPSTGLVTCSIIHFSLLSSFWGPLQRSLFGELLNCCCTPPGSQCEVSHITTPLFLFELHQPCLKG